MVQAPVCSTEVGVEEDEREGMVEQVQLTVEHVNMKGEGMIVQRVWWITVLGAEEETRKEGYQGLSYLF